MSSSRSSSNKSNSSTTHDQRTTNTINAGIGGDIEDSTVISGIDGNVSLRTTDHGAVAGAMDFGSDALDTVSDSIDAVADGQDRALDFGEDALAGAFDFGYEALSGNVGLIEKVLEYNAEQQTEVLDSADKLTELSLTNLAAIKSGETIAKAADRNLLEMKNGLIIVAGITAAAVIGSKFVGRKSA